VISEAPCAALTRVLLSERLVACVNAPGRYSSGGRAVKKYPELSTAEFSTAEFSTAERHCRALSAGVWLSLGQHVSLREDPGKQVRLKDDLKRVKLIAW